MVKFLKSFKQIFNLETEKQKGVGLYVGVESFSLCVIDDIEDIEHTVRFYGSKFPATLRDYAIDFFTNDRSATYIFDYIKEFMPQGLENINLILPNKVANIGVTPVEFANDEQALGYSRFQSAEIFDMKLTEPIFSVSKIESSVSKRGKEKKSKYIVSCAQMRDMVELQKCAIANHINLETAEPVELCALRAYSDLSQGNVLLIFINLSHLFLVALVNGKPEKFCTLCLDTECDGFLEKFSKEIVRFLENFHFEQGALKIKVAGDEMKYKICEVLDKLHIAKEISLAKCKIDLASCEDELAFGAALRNL